MFHGKVIDVFVDRMRVDGTEVEREIVRHPGAVGIVALSGDSTILMVRQHRHAVDNRLLEIPAGKLDENEDPWDCARRELLEETGYRCHHLELLASYYSTPGFSDERIHVFLGSDLEKVTEPPTHDGDEPIAIEWLREDEAVGAIFDGRIVDAKTIIGVALLKLQEHPEDLGVDI